MPITTVIIISLLLANLALTLIMFWIIHDLLSAAKSLQESNDLVYHAFEVGCKTVENYGKELTRVYERESALNKAYESGTKCLTDSYDHILKAYEIMRKQYDSIVDMNTKLLNCWKGCEERYSQSYEEFKHCSDSLKEISYQITDLANVSTEDEYTLTLTDACDTICCDCWYDECVKEECPVWKIKMQQKEIEAEWEEYDEAERWKACHKGDDNVEKDQTYS